MSAPDATQPQARPPRVTPYGYQPGPKDSGVLGNHPQRARIIDAILDGESDLSIEKWVTPRVSRITIGKLRGQVKREKETALLAEKVRQIESLALGRSNESQSVDEFAKAAVLGSRHLERLRANEELLDLGKRIALETGDLSNLTGLIRADHSGIELAGKFDGTLAQVAAQFAAPAVQNNLQVVILPGSMPTDTVEAPAIEATANPLPDTD